MSTRSKSASARKAERAWPPEDIAHWMRAQPLQPPHVGSMARGTEAERHTALAGLFLKVRHDPNPIPIHSEQTPLLP